MVAKRAADEHDIAGLALRSTQIDPFGHNADSTRVDVHAIAMALVDNLRVARYELHTCLDGHIGHALANTLEIGDGIAFFKNETAAQIERFGTARGDVVHRSANRKMPDVATGEEMRRHHKTVGRERKAGAFGQLGKHCGIVTATQLVARICLEEHLVDDATHHRAATAVAKQNLIFHLKLQLLKT